MGMTKPPYRMNPGFYVARCCGPSRIVILESRPWRTREDADNWAEFIKVMNPKHDVFIIDRTSTDSRHLPECAGAACPQETTP